jgi:transcriptional regulator GlxA family with amidase domain
VELLEVLVAPEGRGIRRERYNTTLLNWIRDQSLRVEKVVGICTGVALLAECGLLTSSKAAIHESLLSWMRARYPHVHLAPEEQLVDTGRVVTAAGWKSAFKAGLHVIAKSHGAGAALRTAFRLDPSGRWVHSVGGAVGLQRELAGIESRRFRYSKPR